MKIFIILFQFLNLAILASTKEIFHESIVRYDFKKWGNPQSVSIQTAGGTHSADYVLLYLQISNTIEIEQKDFPNDFQPNGKIRLTKMVLCKKEMKAETCKKCANFDKNCKKCKTTEIIPIQEQQCKLQLKTTDKFDVYDLMEYFNLLFDKFDNKTNTRYLLQERPKLKNLKLNFKIEEFYLNNNKEEPITNDWITTFNGNTGKGNIGEAIAKSFMISLFQSDQFLTGKWGGGNGFDLAQKLEYENEGNEGYIIILGEAKFEKKPMAMEKLFASQFLNKFKKMYEAEKSAQDPEQKKELKESIEIIEQAFFKNQLHLFGFIILKDGRIDIGLQPAQNLLFENNCEQLYKSQYNPANKSAQKTSATTTTTNNTNEAQIIPMPIQSATAGSTTTTPTKINTSFEETSPSLSSPQVNQLSAKLEEQLKILSNENEQLKEQILLLEQQANATSENNLLKKELLKKDDLISQLQKQIANLTSEQELKKKSLSQN